MCDLRHKTNSLYTFTLGWLVTDLELFSLGSTSTNVEGEASPVIRRAPRPRVK